MFLFQVLAFALTEGKVAVHCHAGLGRTGVLVSAYLVYYLRVRSNDAIRYVRLKRPGSVQTRRQIDCVKEFESYFLPQCLVFSAKLAGDPDKKAGRFTLEHCLKRQKYVLHGFEARSLKHLPKLVYRVCERLIKLCDDGGGGGQFSEAQGSMSSLGGDGGSPITESSMDIDLAPASLQAAPSMAATANNISTDDFLLNFMHTFIAYKLDNRGTRLLNFKNPSENATRNGGINFSNQVIHV